MKPLLGPLAKLAAEPLADAAGVGPDARKLLHQGMTIGEYVRLLRAEELNFEVVPLLARILPIRDAVNWATASSELGAAKGRELSDRGQEALAAAKQWASSPDESTQAAALEAAKRAPANEPATWAACAAGLGKTPAVLAEDFGVPAPTDDAAVADAVTGAVRLAALPKTPVIPEAPELEPPLDVSPSSSEVGVPPRQGEESTPSRDQLASIHAALDPFVDLGIDFANGQG
ncbi:MAG: hypothetical protein JJ992_18250 [Planctomycetes bacterium]|nr:hypothetical protein [Planctomycetota bacterium]